MITEEEILNIDNKIKSCIVENPEDDPYRWKTRICK